MFVNTELNDLHAGTVYERIAILYCSRLQHF